MVVCDRRRCPSHQMRGRRRRRSELLKNLEADAQVQKAMA
jgi:hypothetical protein